MHRIYLLFFSLVFVSCSSEELSNNETFVKFFGNSYDDVAVDFMELEDGGFLLLATTLSSAGDSNILLIRTDRKGNQLLYKELGDTLNQSASAFFLSSDGHVVICGDSYKGLQRQSFVYKATIDGELVWYKTYGSSVYKEYTSDIVEAVDGNYVFIGHTNENGLVGDATSTDLFLFKITKDGDSIWHTIRGFDGDKVDQAIKLTQRSDGDFIWLGTEQKTVVNTDIRLTRSNEIGVVIDDNDYPSLGATGSFERALDMMITSDGYLMVGYKYKSSVLNPVIFEVNLSGDTIWTKVPNFIEQGAFTGVYQSASSTDIWVTGLSRDVNSGLTDMLLCKLDRDGNLIWEKKFGGESNDSGKKVLECQDGGVAFLGSVTFGSEKAICLIKTDKDGAF